MVSDLLILTWDFFYWFLLLSEVEEKNNFLTWRLLSLYSCEPFLYLSMHKCVPTYALVPLCLFCPDCCCTWVSSAVCMNQICPIKGQTYCLHHTMQSVIIIIKNKPKQNPSRYEISVKIRCYFCQLWASSEVLYSRMFVPDKVLLFPDTWVLFNVWRFFNLVFFF